MPRVGIALDGLTLKVGLAVLVSLLALVGVSVVQASVPVTISISGNVAPSSGQEGNIVGTFSISGLGEIVNRRVGLVGEFSGQSSLEAIGPGLGPVDEITIVGLINGRFLTEGTSAMISFTGVNEADGQSFQGQLRGDLSTGTFIGFFNIPGKGFLTLIFVEGTGSIVQ